MVRRSSRRRRASDDKPGGAGAATGAGGRGDDSAPPGPAGEAAAENGGAATMPAAVHARAPAAAVASFAEPPAGTVFGAALVGRSEGAGAACAEIWPRARERHCGECRRGRPPGARCRRLALLRRVERTPYERPRASGAAELATRREMVEECLRLAELLGPEAPRAVARLAGAEHYRAGVPCRYAAERHPDLDPAYDVRRAANGTCAACAAIVRCVNGMMRRSALEIGERHRALGPSRFTIGMWRLGLEVGDPAAERSGKGGRRRAAQSAAWRRRR